MSRKPKSATQGPADQTKSGADTKGYPEENPGAQPATAGVSAKKEKAGEDVDKQPDARKSNRK